MLGVRVRDPTGVRGAVGLLTMRERAAGAGETMKGYGSGRSRVTRRGAFPCLFVGVAAVLVLLSTGAAAQVYRGDADVYRVDASGGGGTPTGTANRLALFGAGGTLTTDAGATFTGTGATLQAQFGLLSVAGGKAAFDNTGTLTLADHGNISAYYITARDGLRADGSFAIFAFDNVTQLLGVNPSSCEVVLSVVGAASTSTTSCLMANAENRFLTYKMYSGITGCTSWTVGPTGETPYVAIGTASPNITSVGAGAHGILVPAGGSRSYTGAATNTLTVTCSPTATSATSIYFIVLQDGFYAIP